MLTEGWSPLTFWSALLAVAVGVLASGKSAPALLPAGDFACGLPVVLKNKNNRKKIGISVKLCFRGYIHNSNKIITLYGKTILNSVNKGNNSKSLVTEINKNHVNHTEGLLFDGVTREKISFGFGTKDCFRGCVALLWMCDAAVAGWDWRDDKDVEGAVVRDE